MNYHREGYESFSRGLYFCPPPIFCHNFTPQARFGVTKLFRFDSEIKMKLEAEDGHIFKALEVSGSLNNLCILKQKHE